MLHQRCGLDKQHFIVNRIIPEISRATSYCSTKGIVERGARDELLQILVFSEHLVISSGLGRVETLGVWVIVRVASD